MVSETVTKPIAAYDIKHEFSGSALSLSWESNYSGPFKLYRETVGGVGEIYIGQTGGKGFTDGTAKSGKSYYYRVEFGGETSRGEVLINL